MRTHYLAAICCLLSIFGSFTTAQAQAAHNGAITFNWGEEYELPKRYEDLGFLGNSKVGYIQFGHRSHEALSFQKFSPDLKLASEKEVDLSNLPRDYSSEWLTQIGDKYYWFFSTYEKDEEKERLFVQEVSIENGDVQGAARELHSTGKLGGTLSMTGFYHFKLTDKWNFFSSFDKTKLLVQYRKKPGVRDDNRSNDIIGFQVFDSDMKKLWGREIRMPYTEAMMDNEDYQVDSRGNVYTLAKVYQEAGGHNRKHPNYRFEILKWSADKNEVTKIPFKFTDRFVTAASLTEDNSGNIVVAGYYSGRKGSNSAALSGNGVVGSPTSFFYTGNRSNSVDGAFLLKLDGASNELAELKKGTYEFPVEVLKQYESRRTRRKLDRKNDNDKAEADNLHLRNIVMNADGSIELYGEEDYIVQTTTTTSSGMNGSMSTHTSVTYYYEDILAMKIASDGTLSWVVKIPKQQQGKNGMGGMSFKQYNSKGNSYILFMDNDKNLELEKDETPAVHMDGAGGILMAVKIDENGKTSKAELFDVREEKVNLTVTDFDEVGNNQLIVRGRARHRESRAALITFN